MALVGYAGYDLAKSKLRSEENLTEAEKYTAEAKLEEAKSINFSTPLRYAIILGGTYAIYRLYKK